VTAPPVPSEEKLAKDAHLCAICGHWCGQKCERPREWNQRFIAYCALTHGDDAPEIVLERIKASHPGGRMTSFIIWLRAMVSDWVGQTKRWNEPLDHKAFDEWLAKQVFAARVERQRAAIEATR